MDKIPQFVRYVIVGGFIGVSAVFFRELLSSLLPNSDFYFLVTVILTYSIAILFSYLLQKNYTFRPSVESIQTTTFIRFAIVAVIGGVATAFISVFSRNWLTNQTDFLYIIDSLAFILGALSASILTYLLNLKFVFSK